MWQNFGIVKFQQLPLLCLAELHSALLLSIMHYSALFSLNFSFPFCCLLFLTPWVQIHFSLSVLIPCHKRTWNVQLISPMRAERAKQSAWMPGSNDYMFIIQRSDVNWHSFPELITILTVVWFPYVTKAWYRSALQHHFSSGLTITSSMLLDCIICWWLWYRILVESVSQW